MSVGLAERKLVCDEPAPGVVRLRISNEERRGALDHDILDSLAETVRETDAHCLLLTGTGTVFSAGYDLGDLEGREFEERAETLIAHPFHTAIDALEDYDYPVIAALNGHAIGGGLELAITADIRLAASGIKVGMPPAKLGLVYSHTGLCRFMETCGPANTAELFYVGRTVTAERAREMGLVNQVIKPGELEEYACEMAAEVAANAPLSLSGNKKIVRELRARRRTLPEDLERELVTLRESCFRTDDFREGVRAFTEKRAPQWRGT